MLFIVNGNIYFTYNITIPMGGVEKVKRLKSNRTRVITSYGSVLIYIYIYIYKQRKTNTWLRKEGRLL